MAFDFPATPALNDEFVDATSGAIYVWDSIAWVRKGVSASLSPPAGDFLPLTGGELSGSLDFSVPANLTFAIGPGSIHFKNSVGAHQWTLSGSDTAFTFLNQGVVSVFTVAQGSGVVNFERQPTVGGVPIVLKTEVDALLTRIAALEAKVK